MGTRKRKIQLDTATAETSDVPKRSARIKVSREGLRDAAMEVARQAAANVTTVIYELATSSKHPVSDSAFQVPAPRAAGSTSCTLLTGDQRTARGRADAPHGEYNALASLLGYSENEGDMVSSLVDAAFPPSNSQRQHGAGDSLDDQLESFMKDLESSGLLADNDNAAGGSSSSARGPDTQRQQDAERAASGASASASTEDRLAQQQQQRATGTGEPPTAAAGSSSSGPSRQQGDGAQEEEEADGRRGGGGGAAGEGGGGDGFKAEQRVLGDVDGWPGWYQVMDTGSNKVYYWNSASNEVRWDQPPGPPGPPGPGVSPGPAADGEEEEEVVAPSPSSEALLQQLEDLYRKVSARTHGLLESVPQLVRLAVELEVRLHDFQRLAATVAVQHKRRQQQESAEPSGGGGEPISNGFSWQQYERYVDATVQQIQEQVSATLQHPQQQQQQLPGPGGAASQGLPALGGTVGAHVVGNGPQLPAVEKGAAALPQQQEPKGTEEGEEEAEEGELPAEAVGAPCSSAGQGNGLVTGPTAAAVAAEDDSSVDMEVEPEEGVSGTSKDRSGAAATAPAPIAATAAATAVEAVPAMPAEHVHAYSNGVYAVGYAQHPHYQPYAAAGANGAAAAAAAAAAGAAVYGAGPAAIEYLEAAALAYRQQPQQPSAQHAKRKEYRAEPVRAPSPLGAAAQHAEQDAGMPGSPPPPLPPGDEPPPASSPGVPPQPLPQGTAPVAAGGAAGRKRSSKVLTGRKAGKAASSLISKWQAVRKDLEQQQAAEEEAADPQAQEQRRQEQLQQWRAKQAAAADAEANANFQPLAGDWRAKIKSARREAKAPAEAAAAAAAASPPPSSVQTDAPVGMAASKGTAASVRAGAGGKQAANGKQRNGNPSSPASAAASKLALLQQGLPPGWKAMLDKSSGEVYYGNLGTRETTWDRPS